ncbi:hypothetical protein QYF61_023539 [Mycteria americana]|uniref:Uncharacterized protein n=1 Tax=Mycteria americana TaxID=33587 RepID=A0AAN7PKP9_MYCAM|nr:hypothetical protein QYF61_023539 [Mycteria americana]
MLCPVLKHKNDERLGASLLWVEAERAEIVQPGDEKARGDLISVCKYLTEIVKNMKPDSLKRCPVNSTRGNGHKLKYRKTLEQVIQRDCGVSILGDIKNRTVQHVLGDPALNKGNELLGVFSLKRRRLCGDLIAAFQYLTGAYRKDGEGLVRECNDRTRGNSFKLKKGRFRLDIRKKFFTVWVVRNWNRLSREVLDASSLEVFKARLDEVLSNLV